MSCEHDWQVRVSPLLLQPATIAARASTHTMDRQSCGACITALYPDTQWMFEMLFLAV